MQKREILKHPAYNYYTWTNPNEPDPITLIERVGAGTFKDRVMGDPISRRDTKLGSFHEVTRSIDDLASVIYEESKKPISRENAKEILEFLDETELTYQDQYGSGFLRFERGGKKGFIIQDYSWKCLSC